MPSRRIAPRHCLGRQVLRKCQIRHRVRRCHDYQNLSKPRFSARNITRPVLPRKMSDPITERRPSSTMQVFCTYAELAESLSTPNPVTKAAMPRKAQTTSKPDPAIVRIVRIVPRTNQTSRSEAQALCLDQPPGRPHPALAIRMAHPPSQAGQQSGTAERESRGCQSDKQARQAKSREPWAVRMAPRPGPPGPER